MFVFQKYNQLIPRGGSLSSGSVDIHTLIKTYSFIASYKKDILRKLQNAFYDAKDNLNNQGNFIKSTDSDSDVFEQIEKLSDLLDKGIVSKEEFEDKKAQLLTRI